MAEKSPNIQLAELIHSCPRLLGYGGLFGCLREDHSRFGLFADFVNHAIAQKKFSPAYITTANFIAFIRDRELLEEGALNELEKFLEELRHGDQNEIREEDSNRSQNTLYLLANTLGELGVWRDSAQSTSLYETALENAILSGKPEQPHRISEVKVPERGAGEQPASELAIKESKGGSVEVDTASVADTASAPTESTPAESVPAADSAPEETEKVSPGTKSEAQPEISPVKSDEKAPAEQAAVQPVQPAQPDQLADLELSPKHVGKIAAQPEVLAGAKLSPAEQIASQIAAARILEEGSLGAPMPQTTQGTQSKQGRGETPRRFERVRDIDTPSQMRAPIKGQGRKTVGEGEEDTQMQARSQTQGEEQNRQPAQQQNKKSMLGRLGKGAGIAASLGLGGGLLSQATPAAVAATHAHAAVYGIFQTILELILR